MAIGELATKVVVQYRADTSDIKQKLRELSGEEKKLAESQMRAAEERNKGIEQQIKGLGRLTIGLELIKTAGIDLGKTFKDLTGLTGQLGAAGFAIAGPWGALAGVVAEAAKEYTILGDSVGFADTVLANVRAEAEANAKAFAAFSASISDTAKRLQELTKTTSAYQKLGSFSSGLGSTINGVAGRFFGVDQWSGPFRVRPRATGPAGPERAQIGRVYTEADFIGGAYSTSLGAAAGGQGLDSWDLRALTDQIASDRVNATYDENTRAWMDRLNGVDRSPGAGIRSAQQSQLAQMFGPIEEFDAYGKAFETLSGAVSSAMDAWITGSSSAGEAFKSFVGEAVKGISIQMAMEALKHGAYALGALAFGDAKSASLHGASAAKFAAGAAVAAVAAKALHSGGGGAPGVGGGASGGGVASGGGAQTQAGSAPVIVYGDSFADDAPRARQVRARRIVERAIGTTGVTYG